jgi:LysM repeat protein
MAFHGVAFMFIFAIPGCRSTTKKPVAAAPAPVIGAEGSPLSAPADTGSPVVGQPAPAAYGEVSSIRFSPTRPGTPAATAAVTAQSTPAASYTVVKGDSLWSIAKKNNVTVKQLTAANNLRADSTLKLGQALTIPGKALAPAASAAEPAASATRTAPAAAPAASITHVVKAGETLGAIARKYQVKVGEVATANNIADPTKIRVGQSLKIPGWQAPAAKTAAPAAKPAVASPVPAPALPPAAPAPLAPVFDSPVAPAPAPAPADAPFISPAPESMDAPAIRVEESGAPKIE